MYSGGACLQQTHLNDIPVVDCFPSHEDLEYTAHVCVSFLTDVVWHECCLLRYHKDAQIDRQCRPFVHRVGMEEVCQELELGQDD